MSTQAHPLGFHRYSLRLAFRDSNDEYRGCLRDIEGDIMGHRQEAEPTRLGRINAQLVRVSRSQQLGEDLWSIMDSESADLGWIFRAFYGRNKLLEWPFDNLADNILYISDVDLEEEYRGRDIDLLVGDSLIKALPLFKTTTHETAEIDVPFVAATDATEEHKDDDMPDTDVVLIAPAGMNGSLDYVRTVEEQWARIGFDVVGKQIGGFPVLMGLETTYERPRIRNVVPHLVN